MQEVVADEPPTKKPTRLAIGVEGGFSGGVEKVYISVTVKQNTTGVVVRRFVVIGGELLAVGQPVVVVMSRLCFAVLGGVCRGAEVGDLPRRCCHLST